MATFKRFALASALVASLFVRLGNGAEVWAIAAYINHGERAPLVNAPDTILTPEGAQQMLRQGKAFRARYLANVSDQDLSHIGLSKIHGMDADLIDNLALDITSRTDDYVTGGAMAFFQGLYPPSTKAYEASSSDSDIANDFTESTSNLTDYPLDGYQYANILTLGMLDPTSTNIQGNLRCSAWETETNNNLRDDPVIEDFYNASLPFYQLLFSTPPLQGTIDLNDANAWNAYELYDYVSYMYVHNKTINDGLTNGSDILDIMNSFATTMERAKNAYMNITSDSQEDENKGILYSIAGRTLSYKIAKQFINYLGGISYDKISIMFGGYEPILAFIAMAGLLNNETATEGPFSRLPEPGAAMVFELYGENPQDPSAMPSFDDLEVRFRYRANADADQDFILYSLFGSDSGSGSVTYSEFVDVMQNIGVSSYEWCDVCGSISGPWCSSTFTNEPGTSSKKTLDPVVAGVIGAVIMAVIIAVIAALLFFLAGLRLKRMNVQKDPGNSSVAAGGFKGPEKKDEDRDVQVTNNGARHERVGSWELKDGSTLPAIQTVGATAEVSPREQVRRSLDDDEISIMGATPVKAHESV
ncbi:histidine phosphatase superfamily [Mariannaea sp. PMI_226]|nr:histidine phosphatase superfamily [Mariannaea sp. PMI_226]